MIVECGVCHRQYEDTRRFLNCPHNLTSILPTDTEDVTKEEAEYVSPYIPKNELWMVSNKGDILKIVNIGNHPTPISDEDEPSLCRGESK